MKRISKIDPYTACLVGILLSWIFALSEIQWLRMVGMSFGILSPLQLSGITKGGHLIRFSSESDVYILDNEYAIYLMPSNKNTIRNCLGIAIKGTGQVFRVTDGIHIQIDGENNYVYTSGIGRIVNEYVRSGGLKTKEWVYDQKNPIWVELFEKSIPLQVGFTIETAPSLIKEGAVSSHVVQSMDNHSS